MMIFSVAFSAEKAHKKFTNGATNRHNLELIEREEHTMSTEIRRYSETQDSSYTQADLEAMNLTELVELFNEEAYATCINPVTFRPITKFSDKKNALRRVWAVLTEVTPETEDTDSDDTADTQSARIEDQVNTMNDPRNDQVTCATCGHTDAKRTMDLVGSKWYCSDEDECERRVSGNHSSSSSSEEAKQYIMTPNEHNAPEGMVYCGLCKQHVSADSAEPTAEDGIYTCKELCVGKGNKSLKDKARNASQPKAKREPRQSKSGGTGRVVAFPNDHIITYIADCPKKKGSKAEKGYELYRIGMTVAEYLKLAAEHNCYGREALKYDTDHEYIKIEPATTATTSQPA